MREVENLLKSYQDWLKDKTAIRKVKDWIEITTPYIDRHNDYIQIYLKKTESGYLLTDDGYAIDDLEQDGCSLSSPKRQKLLQLTLNGFGVKCIDNTLQIAASEDNFALSKHSLIQAVLAVNDMFYLAEPHVASLFFEDVRNWLDTKNIRYSETVSFVGHSGFPYRVDFLIPKSANAPERMIKTINNPSKGSTKQLIMEWLDTKDTRPENSVAYAFLNDQDKSISNDILSAFSSYNIHAVPWSARTDVEDDLAA